MLSFRRTNWPLCVMQTTWLVCIAILGVTGTSLENNVTVQTASGPVIGLFNPDFNVTAFYGIPFARPPVGARRFKSPEKAAPWTTPLDCTHHVASRGECLQRHTIGPFVKGQEDCLYLNIFVPGRVGSFSQRYAVMFWIYGGGFIFGSDTTNGTVLASTRQVLVVEANYRVGAHGFLAAEALAQENGDNSTGNYGTQDQQLALKFAHDNVQYFGGDAKRVTIFGQSAGGMSICWHLVSEVSRPLFSGAIMESGSCSSAEFFVSRPRAINFSRIVIDKVGCGHAYGHPEEMLLCLRTKPAVDFMIAYDEWPAGSSPPVAPVMPWGPVVDGSPAGLLKRPIELIEAGRFAHVPFVLGTVQNEGSYFVPLVVLSVPGTHFPLDNESFVKVAQHLFNESTVQAVITAYPHDGFASDTERAAIFFRDYIFASSARHTARAISSFGVPVYLYRFNASLPNFPMYDVYGDYHGCEVSLVFGNDVKHPFIAPERVLSDQMSAYWTNLAKSGSVNAPVPVPTWPLYNATTDMNMYFSAPLTVGQGLDAAGADFWRYRYPSYYFS